MYIFRNRSAKFRKSDTLEFPEFQKLGMSESYGPMVRYVPIEEIVILTICFLKSYE